MHCLGLGPLLVCIRGYKVDLAAITEWVFLEVRMRTCPTHSILGGCHPLYGSKWDVFFHDIKSSASLDRSWLAPSKIDVVQVPLLDVSLKLSQGYSKLDRNLTTLAACLRPYIRMRLYPSILGSSGLLYNIKGECKHHTLPLRFQV